MASNAQALSDKIMTLLNAGQFGRAAKAAKLATKKHPKEAYFSNLAGMALAKSGNEREAALFFHKAFLLKPQNEDIQNNLVQALVISEQHDKAQGLIAKLMPKRNETSELLYLQAMSFMLSGDEDAALHVVTDSVAANPKHVKAHNLRGKILNDLHRYSDAIDSYQAALNLAPDRPDTLSSISEPLSRVDRGDEALAMLERAISINPAHLDARHRYAILLNQSGRQAEAKDAFLALLEIAPEHAETMYELSMLQSSQENAALLPIIQSILLKTPKNALSRVHLNFALAGIYWQQPDYIKAAKALHAANTQKARAQPFDRQHESQQKDAILDMFQLESPSSPHTVSSAGPKPVFVIGLPRSGTTLVEQMLSAHNNVTGFGELGSAGLLVAHITDEGLNFDAAKFAADYRAMLPDVSKVADVFVDKMPSNYRHVGFLAEAFPEARFICLSRDPRDVALSMWRSYLPAHGMGYTFDLEAISHVANLFGEYMAHWRRLYSDRILEIGYEDIVGDIDAASRTLAQFCGLEWQVAMARPEKNKSLVRTASVMQVREGVHKRSVGGWLRMQDQLEPFIHGLDKKYWPDLD